MAEFAAVSDNILLDDEFLTLDPDHQHIWLVLTITPLGGRCGIFKDGVVALARQSGRSVDTVHQALGAFEERGWIERDGKYTWVRGRIKHKGWNKQWLTAALREAAEFSGKTTLAARCLARYEADVKPSRRKMEPSQPEMGPSPLNNNSKQNKAKQEDISPETATAAPGTPATSSKRLKPNTPTLKTALTRLPDPCRAAWEQFASMVASHNKTGTVAESRLAGLLADILNRCQDMPPAALTHGLLAACQAGDGRGAPNPRYVAKAAASWTGKHHLPELPEDDPDPPDVSQVLSRRTAAIDPETARANGLAGIEELLGEENP